MSGGSSNAPRRTGARRVRHCDQPYEVCRNLARNPGRAPDRDPEIRRAGELRLANVREMPHPDVALERARLRYAQECLEGMRRKTASRVAAEHVLAANEPDAEAVKWQLERRLDSLND